MESLNGNIEYARTLTSVAANTKSWRVRGIRNRAFYELAKEINEGLGYIYASPNELYKLYPKLCNRISFAPDGDHRYLWAIRVIRPSYKTGYVGFNFAPIR